MASHSGRGFIVPAAAGSALVAVLAVGFWLVADGRTAFGRQAGSDVLTNPGYFANLQKQAAEQKKKADDRLQKTRAAAQKHIDAQAQARGGRDKLAVTLADINAKLTPPAGQTAQPDATPGPQIEPGQRVDLIMKNDADEYSGTFIGINGTTVLLQTIPLPGADPSQFNLNNVEAFHTSAGLFAYNPRTGRFVPALTFYRLDKATGNFARMSSGVGDAFLTENAKILGPINSAAATLGTAADGSWALGLPIPVTNSPAMIPAANIQEIITTMGVYTYDPKARNYDYKSHVEIADAAQKAGDAATKAAYQQQWNRHVQNSQLTTSRLHAMTPYVATGWGGGPPWWQPGAGPGTAPPGGGG